MLSEIIELKANVFVWVATSFGVLIASPVIPQTEAPWWVDSVVAILIAATPIVIVLIKRRERKKSEEKIKELEDKIKNLTDK